MAGLCASMGDVYEGCLRTRLTNGHLYDYRVDADEEDEIVGTLHKITSN